VDAALSFNQQHQSTAGLEKSEGLKIFIFKPLLIPRRHYICSG